MKRLLLLAVLVAALVVPVSASGRGASDERASDPCGSLRSVSASHLTLCTHGPDVAPTAFDIEVAEATLPQPKAPAPCVKTATETDYTGGQRIRVLYGVPSDRTRSSANRAMIPSWLAQASAALRNSGGKQRYRFYCTGDPAKITITPVTLDPVGDDGLFTYQDLVTSMIRLGFTDRNLDYAVFVDQLGSAYPYGGQGSLASDEQPEPALNDNNDASVDKLAFIKLDPGFGDYDALVFMHEVGHNLGAVQPNAPHASGGSHCFDEYDTLCYDDGGTYFTSGGQIQYLCPTEIEPTSTFDCGKDDYYNAQEVAVDAGGTYLQANWNLARSSWLSPVVGGDPVVTTPFPEFGSKAVTATKDIQVVVKWMATDANGIGSQRLQLKTGSGAWVNVPVSADARSYKTMIPFPSGPYSFRVRATDTKGNAGPWVVGPPFSLTQPTPSFFGTWNTATGSDYLEGSTRYATTQGYGALKTLTGRAFAWVGSKGPAFGTSTVATDGVGTSHSQHATAPQYRRVIYRVGWGVTGQHSVWVNCDATPGTPRCDIDAFVLIV